MAKLRNLRRGRAGITLLGPGEESLASILATPHIVQGQARWAFIESPNPGLAYRNGDGRPEWRAVEDFCEWFLVVKEESTNKRPQYGQARWTEDGLACRERYLAGFGTMMEGLLEVRDPEGASAEAATAVQALRRRLDFSWVEATGGITGRIR